MTNWVAKHRGAGPDYLGLLPLLLSDRDPRPVREQFETNYVGGWNPLPGFSLSPKGALEYPGDPPLPCLYEAKFRNEIIRVYHYAWVAIIQTDGSFEVARMD